MKIILGPPVTGVNFYPRPKLRTRLLRALTRSHVAFIGPRRTGKTSLLEDLRRNPPNHTKVILLDLEKFDNVKDWLLAMTQKTKEAFGVEARAGQLANAGKLIVEQLRRIEKLEAMGAAVQLRPNESNPAAWRPFAEEFLALIQESGERIHFLLDEFPWFLSHIAKKHTQAEVEALMNWFRGARQEMADKPIRFLLTGSIGLEGFLKRSGLSPAANDLDTIEIPPLDDSEADELIERLAEGEQVPLSPSSRKQVRELLGANWPILIELFISEIQDAAFTKSPTKSDVKRIYEEQLVRGSRNKYCDEMFTRLNKPELFTVGQRNLAKRILLTLVRNAVISMEEVENLHQVLVPSTPVRETMEDDVAFVVDTLRHDGYITRLDGGKMTFASNILRDFWRHRVGR